MNNYSVSERKEANLLHKMKIFGIKESDLIEKFIRSRGPGGQKVNKTSSCVYLKHIPTKIEVKCDRERSRPLNRYFARINLTNKIENMIYFVQFLEISSSSFSLFSINYF